MSEGTLIEISPLEIEEKDALRQWLPTVDHNGNPPSPEQNDIMSHFIHLVYHGLPVRFVIEAVAGSGKTTLLRMLFDILANAHHCGRKYSITATAFNGSIAGVVVDAMNAVKPDGADWTSGGGTGTLNSHGKKTVVKFFDHPVSLVTGVDLWLKYAKIVVCNSLADDDLFEDFTANVLVNPSTGFKRSMSSWYALCRLVANVTKKALGAGFYAPIGSTVDAETWDRFIGQNMGSLRLSEQPIGAVWTAHLQEAVEETISLRMYHMENPSEVAVVNADALLWKGDALNGFFDTAENTLQSDLVKMGLKIYPVSTKAGDSIQVIPYHARNYRTGNFDVKRLEIVWPKGTWDEMKAVQSACWAIKNDGIFTPYSGFSNDGAKTPENYDKRSQAKFQTDQWVFSIKDSKRDIDAFIQCATTAGFDYAGAFDASTPIAGGEEAFIAEINHIDCIYAPAYFDMPAWRTFDFMFCDEVQDMSPLQHSLLERLVAKDGNVVIVGDRRQSLYLFSGADSRSMDYAIDTYGCQSFPMTVCWRQSDVLANEVVSALGYVDGEKTIFADHKSAKTLVNSWRDGFHSHHHHISDLTHNVEIGDMVLCRISAPLVAYAMATLKSGIPVRLAGGGDLESQVKSMWSSKNKLNMENRPIDEIFTAIEDYLTALLARITKRVNGDETLARQHDDYKSAQDMTTAVTALFGRYGTTALTHELSSDGFLAWLEDLFVDPTDTGEGYVMFSTVHRAKGLERDTVHIIVDRMSKDKEGKETVSPCFMLPWSMNNDAEIQQELNAVYVCITRAMNTQRFYTNHPLESGSCGIADILWMLDNEAPSNRVPVAANEAVVDESTSDEEEAIEAVKMPLFALFEGGVCVSLTDDNDKAMNHIIECAGEDYDISEYEAGTYVNDNRVYADPNHPLIDHAVYLTDLPMGNDVGQSINEYLKDMHDIYDHSDHIELFGAGIPTFYFHTTDFAQPVIGDETPAPARTRKTSEERWHDVIDAYFALESREHGITIEERKIMNRAAVIRHKSLAKEAGMSDKTFKRILDEAIEADSNCQGLKETGIGYVIGHWQNVMLYTVHNGEELEIHVSREFARSGGEINPPKLKRGSQIRFAIHNEENSTRTALGLSEE